MHATLSSLLLSLAPFPSTLLALTAAGASAGTSRFARPSSGAAGGSDPIAKTNASGTVAGSGPGGPLPASAACVPSLRDLSPGGSCLSASSNPTLGALYPLSLHFNVDPDGRVGLGTTAPQANLQVSHAGYTVQPAMLSANDRIVVASPDSVLGLYSGPGGSWGSAISLAEMSGAELSDKWSIARTTAQAGSELRFTYGANALYSSNPPTMTLEPDGHVGIGTVNPGFPLQVENPDGTAFWAQSGVSYAMVATSASDMAGFFDGSVDVGFLGTFGLPVGRVQLTMSPDSQAGVIRTMNSEGLQVNRIETDPNNSGRMRVFNQLGGESCRLGVDSTDAGFLQLFDAAGVNRILLDSSSAGLGRITTDVLEITGGADLVESFDTGGRDVEPGTVMVIDPDARGRLRVADEPYDRKVAGVVSGAGGVRAGLSLGQDGVSGDTPVALTGRVYVRATAENGPIRAGDRLTTSSTAGHAMRVSDAERADGAVLGKAMTALDEGTGLVLVLVNLQ